MLRHQLIVLRRKVQGRVRLSNHDRWFVIQLYGWFPFLDALGTKSSNPKTVLILRATGSGDGLGGLGHGVLLVVGAPVSFHR